MTKQDAKALLDARAREIAKMDNICPSVAQEYFRVLNGTASPPDFLNVYRFDAQDKEVLEALYIVALTY